MAGCSATRSNRAITSIARSITLPRRATANPVGCTRGNPFSGYDDNQQTVCFICGLDGSGPDGGTGDASACDLNSDGAIGGGEEEACAAGKKFVSNDETRRLFAEICGYTDSQTQDDAFEENARRSLGYGEGKWPDGNQADGIRMGVMTSGGYDPGLVNAGLEVKHVGGYVFNSGDKIRQAARHVGHLEESLNATRDRRLVYVPTYIVASTSPYLKLDGSKNVITGAEQKGIAVYHLRLKQKDGGGFYMGGRLVTDQSTAGAGADVEERPPMEWPGTPDSNAFSFECTE